MNAMALCPATESPSRWRRPLAQTAVVEADGIAKRFDGVHWPGRLATDVRGLKRFTHPPCATPRAVAVASLQPRPLIRQTLLSVSREASAVLVVLAAWVVAGRGERPGSLCGERATDGIGRRNSMPTRHGESSVCRRVPLPKHGAQQIRSRIGGLSAPGVPRRDLRR